MNRLLSLAAWLLLLSLALPRAAAATPEPPPLATFVELVRGHDVTTIRRSFPAYNTGLLAQLYGAGPGIVAETPEAQALFGEQLAVTPAGHVLDIGHVITGLEAAAAPSTAARLVERQTGCDLRAAVTWSGDAGNALHAYLAAGGDGDSDAFFDREAPPEDLLGDIDGWLLALPLGPGALDVAALLADAYLSGGDFERSRFQRFAESVSGGLLEREIICFARATALLGGCGVSGEAIEAAAPPFIARFRQYLEAGIAAELAATP